MSVIRIFDYAANLYKEAFEINQESDTLIDCILTFIEFNLEKQFTIDDLCRWYNTNRTTLMTEFKHITGKTINEFVIDKRISVSKRYLNSPIYLLRNYRRNVVFKPVILHKNI